MSQLGDGGELYQGQCLSSGNGYYALMQTDGNFVLYRSQHWIPQNAIWSSGTSGEGTGPFRLVMQNDGNLVIYDTYNKATWASNTYQQGAKPHFLEMQTDGNLVIYDGNRSATWASDTAN